MEEKKTTKKTTTAKKTSGTTKAKTTAKTKKEEAVEMVEEVVETKTTGRLSGRMRKKSDTINTDNLDRTRRVPVISVDSGTVGYQCSLSPTFLTWEGYGDEQEMSIGELLLMYSQNKMFINDPILLVDDEEFADTFKLTEKYEAIFDTEDLADFYRGKSPSILANKIRELPNTIRRQVLQRTVIAVNTGELENLAVIKMLKKEFDLDVEVF